MILITIDMDQFLLLMLNPFSVSLPPNSRGQWRRQDRSDIAGDRTLKPVPLLVLDNVLMSLPIYKIMMLNLSYDTTLCDSRDV